MGSCMWQLYWVSLVRIISSLRVWWFKAFSLINAIVTLTTPVSFIASRLSHGPYGEQVQYASILNSFVSSLEKPRNLPCWPAAFRSLQMVMHSILASRIFFNLRETTRREEGDSPSIPLSEFHANSQQSSGFSSSMGTSSSSSRNDPKVVDITREPTVHSWNVDTAGWRCSAPI